MKLNLFFYILILFLCAKSQVFAAELKHINYNFLKENAKICFKNYHWDKNIKRNDNSYFIKINNDKNMNAYDYISNIDYTILQTDWDYDFLYNGRLIGYSNKDMKFYEIISNDNNDFTKITLSIDEIQELFPKFKIIKLSDFSVSTNSLKIKKNKSVENIILINDININLENYIFTTGNAKIKKYNLPNFLTISSKGMIQFSEYGEKSKTSRWFILLVR